MRYKVREGHIGSVHELLRALLKYEVMLHMQIQDSLLVKCLKLHPYYEQKSFVNIVYKNHNFMVSNK